MSDGLKPCPFCKHEAVMMVGGFGEVWPECTNPECGVRFSGGIWVNKESAELLVAKWNDRYYDRPPEDGTDVDNIIS